MTAIELNKHLLSFENNLRKFAISLTSNLDDASDLVQETYLKAYSYKERLSDYSNIRSWIFSIMKNTFINDYHKSRRKPSAIDEENHSQLMNKYNDEGKSGPDAILSEGEILEAIEKLDPKFRTIFKLHLNGYKYNEIAEKMDINIGTVKSRIFNTRQILMDALKDLRN